MNDELLREVLTLLRSIDAKLTRLCEAVESAREPSRSMRHQDRVAPAKILPVLAAYFPGEFGTWERVDAAAATDATAANLRLVLGASATRRGLSAYRWLRAHVELLPPGGGRVKPFSVSAGDRRSSRIFACSKFAGGGARVAADAVQRWPINRLKPFPNNARTHSEEQVEQIAASIREWGWTVPIPQSVTNSTEIPR